MRKIFIFAFFLLLSFGIECRQHTIAKIFEEGKAIELNDGSIWAIGYWRWNDPFDQQVVTADWQIGDHLEFFSLWKGVSSKAAFHITNLRSGQSVRSWLYRPPHEESLLLVKEINPSRNTLILEDGSKWQIREGFNTYFHLYEIAWDQKVYLLKNTQGNFYLCRASSEIPQGVEVFQIHN